MDDNKVRSEGLEESKETALHYFETLVNVARESFLILDANLRVISANPVFYENFKVSPTETENKLLYELENGQWDIQEFRKLLEEILPKKKVVKNYEVEHYFETIGKKTILLNARQIDTVQLIILAMEDITIRKDLDKKLASHTTDLEIEVAEKTRDYVSRVGELEALNKTMIGRELKMIELKKEVERLEKLARDCSKDGGYDINKK